MWLISVCWKCCPQCFGCIVRVCRNHWPIYHRERPHWNFLSRTLKVFVAYLCFWMHPPKRLKKSRLLKTTFSRHTEYVLSIHDGQRVCKCWHLVKNCRALGECTLLCMNPIWRCAMFWIVWLGISNAPFTIASFRCRGIHSAVLQERFSIYLTTSGPMRYGNHGEQRTFWKQHTKHSKVCKYR